MHFACHGQQDLDEPSRNAVLLHDEPLTVLDVARLGAVDAELAFLSACATASGGATLPDEAIHLASSLQTAGFRHVIATLWPIYDAVAPQVGQDVYQALADAGQTRDLAALLHQAVRRLRDRDDSRSPLVWAPYVHIGAVTVPGLTGATEIRQKEATAVRSVAGNARRSTSRPSAGSSPAERCGRSPTWAGTHIPGCPAEV
ncbi:hypothetical protein UK82_17350 [Frankia sp. ACN1ag]|nr:hypothetical protein UK82_17350 [Frankia sp. ACN1ag]